MAVVQQKKMLLMAVRAPLLKAFAEREGLMPASNDRKRYYAMQQQSNRARLGGNVTMTPEQREDQWLMFGERPIIEIRTAHALWKKDGGSVGIGSLGSCVLHLKRSTSF